MPVSHSPLFASSPTWAAMLADPSGPAAGAKLDFDENAPYPWQQNRAERQAMEEKWSQLFPPSKYGYERAERKVTMRDGEEITVMVYQPSDRRPEEKLLPLVFNTHGGGWYQGSTLTEEIFLMRVIMSAFRFVIVSPEYRLAPERPFPGPLDDCMDTYLWALRSSDELGFDRREVLLAASSAGGSLTAAIAAWMGKAMAGKDVGNEEARKYGFGTETRIRGVILNVPIVCHPRFFPTDGFEITSYKEATAGTTLLCSEEMYKIWDLYAPSTGQYSGANVAMSPLLDDLSDFPPCKLYVAGQDPVRDEAVAFAEKLKKSGREVDLIMYPGVPHVFAAFDDLHETKQFWRDCQNGIRALMGS
ncbi:Alpha/Beta hydrolase protein [Xylaria sp. FL0933]|nr:Alpha/Beta hydrolase protein [Xylaria sp. FL0933]